MSLPPHLVPLKLRQKFQRSRSNSEVSSLPKKEGTTISMTTASPTQTVFDESGRGRWTENDGHLAVPGANYHNGGSSPTSPGGSSTRSSSRGSSIGALVMVPAIVGGAVAGWNPELKPPGNN